MTQKIIKDDINFLEYPNWVIGGKGKSTTFTILKDKGKYEIMSPHGLPKRFDKIVMYYLLYKLYQETSLETCTVSTNRYEIAKNIFNANHFGKNVYDRVMRALKKWNAISIEFEGVFYEDEHYSIKYFHIVDDVKLHKATGMLTVRFNEEYIKQLKDSKFYKLVDFEQYKKLHKASSARLYEILVKNFKDRKEWSIGIQLLAEKLTFEKRDGAKSYYPSDVLPYLKSSIQEINKKTDMQIAYSYNSETKVCIFKLQEKSKAKFVPAVKDASKKKEEEKELKACILQFKSLTTEEQEKIRIGIGKDQFFRFLPNEDTRIFAYMKQNGYLQL
eukprot:Pompholyxophrys_punicea_v1_NODE_636_length_1548_cov_7.976557.p1 type:complete len:330 gc:universal NODE_636_length_1548_cov_7.976557:1484-495(-)